MTAAVACGSVSRGKAPPTVEDRAGSAALPVEIERIPALQALEGATEHVRLGPHHEMKVRPHQAVRVDLEVVLFMSASQTVEKRTAIAPVGKQTQLIQGSRCDVKEACGRRGAKRPRHARNASLRCLVRQYEGQDLS